MPILANPEISTVLVSGANSYIALWTIRVLLERGFTVRGTVRSEAKSSLVKSTFASESYGGRLDVVIVEDITVEGAFDSALKGVDAVIHTAAPGSTEDEADPEVFFNPAIQAAQNILKSAAKSEYSQIKRIVLTSSAGALLPLSMLLNPTEKTAVDESNWADDLVEVVRAQRREAHSLVRYSAAKTLAERAVWQFYEAHKAELSWDLVVLLPSQTIGPPVQDFTSPTELSSSVSIWYDNVFNDQTPEATLNSTFVYVDVRDVARAHVESLVREEAAGQRIIVSAGSTLWQSTRDSLSAAKPELYKANVLPRGNPATEAKPTLFLNSKKAEEILGIKYITFEESNLATFVELESRGFVGKKN